MFLSKTFEWYQIEMQNVHFLYIFTFHIFSPFKKKKTVSDSSLKEALTKVRGFNTDNESP